MPKYIYDGKCPVTISELKRTDKTISGKIIFLKDYKYWYKGESIPFGVTNTTFLKLFKPFVEKFKGGYYG